MPDTNESGRKQELFPSDLEKAAGGSVVDAFLVCYASGHEWKKKRGFYQNQEITYKQLVCTRCGEIKYTKKVYGQAVVEITEGEFFSVYHGP